MNVLKKLIFFLFSPALVLSSSQSFMPFQVGNRWYFENYNYGWNPDYSYNYYDAAVYEIIKSEEQNAKLVYTVKKVQLIDKNISYEYWGLDENCFYRNSRVNDLFGDYSVIYDRAITKDTTWSSGSTFFYSILCEEREIWDEICKVQSRKKQTLIPFSSGYSSIISAEKIGLLSLSQGSDLGIAFSCWAYNVVGAILNGVRKGNPIRPVGIKINLEPDRIHLRWRRNFEENISHYRIYTGATDSNLVCVDSTETASDTTFYLSIPDTHNLDNYYLALSAITFDGVESNLTRPNDMLSPTLSVKREQKQLHEPRIYQNYPNPFNPETTIKFDISQPARVKLVIYNITGQEVATALDEYKGVGEYSIKYNASHLPSGLYLYELWTENFRMRKKMLLVR